MYRSTTLRCSEIDREEGWIGTVGEWEELSAAGWVLGCLATGSSVCQASKRGSPVSLSRRPRHPRPNLPVMVTGGFLRLGVINKHCPSFHPRGCSGRLTSREFGPETQNGALCCSCVAKGHSSLFHKHSRVVSLGREVLIDLTAHRYLVKRASEVHLELAGVYTACS